MTTVLWLAIALMLGGAAFLVADVGSAGIWIPVITVGVALAVIGSRRGGSPLHR